MRRAELLAELAELVRTYGSQELKAAVQEFAADCKAEIEKIEIEKEAGHRERTTRLDA